MAYVPFYHISYKKERDKHADAREDQIYEVPITRAESGNEVREIVHHEFQNYGGKSAKDSYHKGYDYQ